MKRQVRFVLLALGYLFAVVRVAVRRVSNSKNKAKHSRRLTRRRVGMVSGSALALLGLVIAGNLLSPPANAVTIRSGSGSDSCTVDVGSAANASVTKNGDYCIVTVTANTTVSFPAYISQIGIIVVGAGGGGGPDGGTGGAGGEVRSSNAQNVTAGGTVTVSLGAGGAGGVWAGAGSTNGGSTTVSGAGVSYTANGGGAGGGWQNTTWSTGGSGGSGGAGSTGGSGAIGPINPNGDTTVALGSTGSNGPAVAIGGLGTTYFGGGGGGGSCYNGRNALTTGVLGALGGAGGGGRGANYRYNLDDITYNTLGGTFGHNGTANTGGGGGGGMACDAYASGQNGTYQRTPGGNGSNGVAVMSWQENRTSVTQAPDGCLYNVAEACLQAAKIQLTNAAGAALTTSGVTVALVSTSVGSLGGTLSATTDSSGTATLNAFWITGAAIGNTPTLTFEAVGYRNVQTTITMKGYAETLNVVSGSTDSNGAFFGTTGIWLATASSSNLSATTLQNELTARNVTLRASAASSSNVLGDLLWNSAATVTETASSTRTLNLKSSRNVSLNGSARVTSSGQQLNVIVQTDTDGTNGGTFHLDGSASAYGIETNGGSVAIGGGTATTTWNALTIPASYAAGYAQYTGTWWGVELGVNTDIANNKLISTGGGKVRINGYAWASPNVSALYGIAWESGRIDAGAGDIDLIGATNGSPSTATNDNWGVALGANRATANDRPVLVTAGTATLNGSLTTPGTSNYWGVAVGYSNVTTGAGGFNITSTSRSIIWEGCAVTGPTNLAGSAAYLTGTNSYTG
ncbi:MAG: hypothetical protein ORN27_00155, partial [Rhodoluna sp.]|nr:hypothetical protein [Rhodoluna sp.]